ncbi:HTH_Tnp_Tc3_2 domain-containing protein [Trichonephila clavipes]|nr:HTH_Tnp_Tc3_2 domain-containing protein [Trichonephila clavipes]
METISNHTDSCPKARRLSPKGYNHPEDPYIAIVAKRSRRAISTRVASMVTASIGNSISAATLRRRLHMNGMYSRVPRVYVPLSVQSRGARLKWAIGL